MDKFLTVVNTFLANIQTLARYVTGAVVGVGTALVAIEIVVGWKFGVLASVLSVVRSLKLSLTGNVFTIIVVMVIGLVVIVANRR